MTPFAFLLLGLAAYRITRLIVTDEITEPVRVWAGRWPKGLGYLLTCPHCASPYIAVGLVLVYVHGPAWLWYAAVVVPACAAVVSLLALVLPED